MDVFKAIKTRRSVRDFTEKQVPDSAVEEILDAGRWAPSGLNNQPWKFSVVRDSAIKDRLASCTIDGKIVKKAQVVVAVFLDSDRVYERTKDVQSIGACIQNMLLAIHNLKFGGVWLGEILNKRKQAESILNAPAGCELMALLAIGFPKSSKQSSTRRKQIGRAHV